MKKFDAIAAAGHWKIPAGVTPLSCSEGNTFFDSGFYLSFKASPATTYKFAEENSVNARDSDGIGVQKDVAQSQKWPIAKVGLIGPGIFGDEGTLDNGVMNVEATFDMRDPAKGYFTYVYSSS